MAKIFEIIENNLVVTDTFETAEVVFDDVCKTEYIATYQVSEYT